MKKLSLTAFIISLLALTDVYFGLLPGSYILKLLPIILSILFGIIALVQIKKKSQQGTTVAIIAIVLGFIALYPFLLYFTV